MRRAARLLRAMTLLGIVATAAGLLVVLGQSFAETRTDPTLSLEDGYRIGRLPWIQVGTVLVVLGANVALVAGTILSELAGGWVRRLLAFIPAAVAVAWWLGALIFVIGGGACPTCPPPSPDPFTMAYSLPDETLLLLVLPAVLAAALALTAPRAHRGSD
jgi:hypothetical protein